MTAERQITLSDEQETAAQQAEAFIRSRTVDKPYFCIQGLAGSGKSRILAALAERYPSTVMCAPTGKAASVIARRTGRACGTVHSAIYNFRGEHIDDEGEKQLVFAQKVNDGLWRGRIVLLDECAMTGRSLALDLLATGCRIVAAGDPGQLQPVKDVRFFDTADVTLTEIHRQALNSGIIRQAHAIRHTSRYAVDLPDVRVQREVSAEDILSADVILCWRNATRHGLNTLVRAHKGLSGLPPQRGEEVVCLRNDHDLGVLNGARYTLLEHYDMRNRVLRVVNERGVAVGVRRCQFEQVDFGFDPNERDSHPFAFGYALTVHKAQSGGYGSVILVDEYNREQERREWLYTACTRAEERLLIHAPWVSTSASQNASASASQNASAG